MQPHQGVLTLESKVGRVHRTAGDRPSLLQATLLCWCSPRCLWPPLWPFLWQPTGYDCTRSTTAAPSLKQLYWNF